MKLTKRLLLGAGLAAATGGAAAAADLASIQPVQYVKVCDAYGAGFFYIPGTQTCLQISGAARAQMIYAEPKTVFGGRGATAAAFNARAQVNFDARSQTPWGTLRAYFRLQSDFLNNNIQLNNYVVGGVPPANGMYVDKAFIQFGGLTAGFATSFFDFYASADTFLLEAGSDQTTLLAAYTADFGSGFTATLSAEDRRFREAGQTVGPGILGGGGATGYGGNAMPDIVGNVNYTAGWGAVQLSGAVHQMRVLAPVGSNYGFAVQAGVKLNLPMLGAGDTFYLQGAYADGAVSYLGPVTLFGLPADGALVGTSIKATAGWTVVGEYMHYWVPSLRSVFAAFYTSVDQPASAGLPDATDWRLSGSLIWSPVSDLDLGLEVGYQQTYVHAAGAVAAATRSQLQGIARIERRF